MKQTKLQSWVESLTQTFVAFSLSVVIQPPIYKFFLGEVVTYGQSIELAIVFTLISLVRSYIVRRGFNWLHHKGL